MSARTGGRTPARVTARVDAGAPPVPSGDGRRARALATRAAILAAATSLFASRGVSATSVDDIAAKAGIAKGSIYNNFASKTGLVASLIEAQAGMLDAILTSAAEGLTGPAQRRAIVAALLRAMQEHPDATRMIVAEAFRTEHDWRESVHAWRDVTTARLRDSLQAEKPHATRDACTVEASALVGATLSAGMEWLAFRPHLTYEEVLAATLTAVGLAADTVGHEGVRTPRARP